jgi:hypothetical protein
MAYKEIIMIKEVFKAHTNLCKAKYGTLLGDKDSIKSRWTEYFKQLLNPIQSEEGQEQVTRIRRDVKITNEERVEPLIKEELEKAIKALKHNKAPGLDEIPSELWNIGGADLIEVLSRLISKVWNREQMPSDWKESIICRIYKKGNKLVHNNYRGISLLCVSYSAL